MKVDNYIKIEHEEAREALIGAINGMTIELLEVDVNEKNPGAKQYKSNGVGSKITISHPSDVIIDNIAGNFLSSVNVYISEYMRGMIVGGEFKTKIDELNARTERMLKHALKKSK